MNKHYIFCAEYKKLAKRLVCQKLTLVSNADRIAFLPRLGKEVKLLSNQSRAN